MELAGLAADLGAIVGPPDDQFWRYVTAPFFFEDAGYLFACGLAIALFLPPLERRIAPDPPFVFIVGGGANDAELAAHDEPVRHLAPVRQANHAAAGHGRRVFEKRQRHGGAEPAQEVEGVDVGRAVARVEIDLHRGGARRSRGVGAPADVYDKDELVGRILAVVGGTFELAQGVQLAALVVAALTIANTMFTAVLERRWEMGLERAIGMGSSQLARTVLLEAAVIGAIGGAGGALLGAVTGFFMTQAMEAEFSWRIPYVLPILLALASIAGVLAAVGPARRAAKLDILDAIASH